MTTNTNGKPHNAMFPADVIRELAAQSPNYKTAKSILTAAAVDVPDHFWRPLLNPALPVYDSLTAEENYRLQSGPCAIVVHFTYRVTSSYIYEYDPEWNGCQLSDGDQLVVCSLQQRMVIFVRKADLAQVLDQCPTFEAATTRIMQEMQLTGLQSHDFLIANLAMLTPVLL